jgi:Fe-S oxidoreductase
MELSSRIREFIQSCQNCCRCKRVCPFLDTYGTPDKIITETPEKVFFCTNCKACDTVCKEKLNPSDVLFEIKTQLLRSGTYPVEVKNALRYANGYAMRGHKPPFVYYSSGDTVFWPGCGLAGMNPEIVKKTVRLLSKHLNKQVGLVLDCCFDPLYQLGDIDSVEKALERIRVKLKKHGITRVITGCTSCTKILSSHLSETKLEHVIEALPPAFLSSLDMGGFREVIGSTGGLFLHHPCPSFGINGIRERAKEYIRALGYGSQLSKNTESSRSSGDEIRELVRPSCCGYGGGINSLSPDFSEEFTEKVIRASKGNPVVTYCMGCKGKFLQGGQKTYHILEFMTGVKPIEKPVSSAKKWANRFLLASGQKFNPKKILVGLLVILLIVLPVCIAYVAFGSSMGELILKGNLMGLVIGIIVASAAMLLPFALKPLVRKVPSPEDN